MCTCHSDTVQHSFPSLLKVVTACVRQKETESPPETKTRATSSRLEPVRCTEHVQQSDGRMDDHMTTCTPRAKLQVQHSFFK